MNGVLRYLTYWEYISYSSGLCSQIALSHALAGACGDFPGIANVIDVYPPILHVMYVLGPVTTVAIYPCGSWA